jgi:RNA polymerase sigma factor (TIGR02999 family)
MFVAEVRAVETAPGVITALLARANRGEAAAMEELIPLVYGKLRQIARSYMRGERWDHTLQATALVHEAFLDMVDGPGQTWQNRAHFIGVAARQMRRILIDYSRSRLAAKRGGGHRLSLDEAPPLFSDARSADLIALDDALNALEKLDSRLSRIVELRYFGGLTVEETAEALSLSADTIKREWAAARAWLQARLSGREP